MKAVRRVLILLAGLAMFATGCTATATVDDAADEDRGTETAPAGADDGEPGGATPIAAVEKLVAAVNAGDPTGVLAVIDPAERDTIERLYAELLDGLEREWPSYGGVAAIVGLGPELATADLSAEELAPWMAWVSTPRVDISVASPTDTIKSLFGGEVSGQSAGTDSVFGTAPGLVVVERDGRWFVSPARTPLEVLRRHAELASSFAPTRESATPNFAASPEQALENLAGAVRAGDTALLAAALAPGEAQIVTDYEPIMRDWLLEGLAAMELTVDIRAADVVAEADGRATVEVVEWFAAADGNFDTDTYFLSAADSVEGTGTCVFWRGVDDKRSGCAAATDPYGKWAATALTQGWEGPRVVAVEFDEGWLISLLETGELWAGPHVESPSYGLLFFPWWDATSALPGVIQSQVGELEAQGAGLIETKLIARDLVAVARIRTGPTASTLNFFGMGFSYCDVGYWPSDVALADWPEGRGGFLFDYWSSDDEPLGTWPDDFFFEDFYKCEEGLWLPSDSDLTVVVVDDEPVNDLALTIVE